MAADQDPQAEAVRFLEDEADRHPPDRYPVQHATAHFHLATVHLNSSRPRAAEGSLLIAARLFAGLPLERAKAMNMLGVTRRALGDAAAAAAAFREAEQTFSEGDQPLEQAAAAYNLGLVHLDDGDDAKAATAFGRALELFHDGAAWSQASAAGRELSAALLRSGDHEGSVEAAHDAMAHAERARDLTALGAAANVAGLAQLGLGRTDEAITSFRAAAGANPRSLRPEGYAMAKANLALAHEKLGDAPNARLVARQARDTPGGPLAARDQARAVLERLPGSADDLVEVLVHEPDDRWPGVAREELLRWADAAVDDQQIAAADLVAAHLDERIVASDLAVAWLGVLIELPPAAMDLIVLRLVEALDPWPEPERARFRSVAARAMAQFHVPQLLRLRDAFERAAEHVGQEGSWM
jgi:tetratricopeptide (TPR) repeat protein